MTSERREAMIVVEGHQLTSAQSMAVRVAIASYRMSLHEPSTSEALGPLADQYEVRLAEVEALFVALGQEDGA